MKKRRNPICSILLAALVALMSFMSVAPAIAETPAEDVVTEPAHYATVVLHVDPDAPNSGYFQITLSAHQGAIFTVFVNDIPRRPYTETRREVPLDKRAEIGFSNLAPGDEVYACLNTEFVGQVCSSVYQVPTGNEPVDTDQDGINDNLDQCPNTPVGTAVDANGCAVITQPVDTDGDGVIDLNDRCRDVPAGPNGTPDGCPPVIVPEPVDTDQDGINDNLDQCANTPIGTVVDANGCAIVVPPQPPTTVEVGVKLASLQQGCPAGQEIVGAHFVITQSVDAEGNRLSPQTISVQLSNVTTVTANRTAVTGGTAHYGVALTGGVTVTNAIALLPSTWTGEFNLSHYNCGEPVPPVDACPEMEGDQAEGTDCNPVTPPVDVCPELPGNQPEGTDCNPVVDACPEMEGDQAEGTDCNPVTPPVDVCPEMGGNQPVGTDCNPVTPPVDTCPDMEGDQAEGTDCNPAVVPETEVDDVTPVVVVETDVDGVTPVVVRETAADETHSRSYVIDTAASEPAGPVTGGLAENSIGGAIAATFLLALWLTTRRRATA